MTMQRFGKCSRPGSAAALAAIVTAGLLLGSVWPGVLAHGAPPTEDTDPSQIESLLSLYNHHTDLPLPVLAGEQLVDLLAGKTILIRDRTKLENGGGEKEDRIRATGYRLFNKPRLQVWVSTLYKAPSGEQTLKERLLHLGDQGDYTLYQYLELPWPIRDRHWTIDISKATQLAARTDGVIWEHHWRLSEDGQKRGLQAINTPPALELDADDLAKAVYLPINRGGWVAIRVSEHSTLLVAHVTTVMSGWIPDRFVAIYTTRTLNKMMSAIGEYTERVNDQYDHRRFPVFSGTGELILKTCLLHPEPRISSC